MEETNSTIVAAAGVNGGATSSDRNTTANSNVETTPEQSQKQTTANDEIATASPRNDNLQSGDVQEPQNNEEVTTEDVEVGQKVTNWEKIAKDNQASFTKISQEKAELTNVFIYCVGCE